MKNLFAFAILFTFVSCLVPPAPHTNWYKPVMVDEKVQLKHHNYRSSDVYYKFMGNDSLVFYISLRVGSMPNKKILKYDLLCINDGRNEVAIFCDSIQLKSNTLDLEKECQLNSVKTLESLDTLKINYEKEFLMNDRKWNRRFSKYDTLLFDFRIQGEKYLYPFYFNKKDRLETYPF